MAPKGPALPSDTRLRLPRSISEGAAAARRLSSETPSQNRSQGVKMASGMPASSRRLHKEVIVPVGPERAWKAWTSATELERWFAHKARVELQRGGPFEILFSDDAPVGKRGSEGCVVLSYLPNEMLSFTWNFPPSLPELRDKRAETFVVIGFHALGDGKTRVTLDSLGWGVGPDWDRGFDYFDQAWGQVLAGLLSHLSESS